MQGVQFIAPQTTSSAALPVIEDMKADSEAIIDPEIQKLADDLGHNPAKIFDYVYNNISYEPYYSAKKGSLGCLHEKTCNDYDTSSLLIALYRASGIPAHYEKQLSVFSVAQLKSLLGVQDIKSAFSSLSYAQVPIFGVSGNSYASGSLESLNLSQETQFAVEWVRVQAYLDYDNEGSNKSVVSSLPTDTTENLRTALALIPNMQWINIDATVKRNTSTRNEILADTASFDSQAFWEGFLQYQGGLSPINKYKSDLQSATSKSVDQNLSTKSITSIKFDALPITLPYYLVTSVQNGSGTTTYTPTVFSTVADNDRQKVSIVLKKETNGSILLEKTFSASEVNNLELELSYKGKTQTDEDIISQYGGINLTPSQLVDIVPYFSNEKSITDGSIGTKI